MYSALGQFVDQPAVYGTECKLALLCSCAESLNIVQDPAKLRAGEIRVKHKTGFVISAVGDVRIFLHQLCLHISSSAALPHDCVVNGLSCLLIPYNNSFTLVSDTDGSDVLISSANILHSLTSNGELCLPDLTCIVLNPARLRIILSKFLLSHAADLALLVEEDTSVTGCACIQCHYILCHKIPPSNFAVTPPHAGMCPHYMNHTSELVVEIAAAPLASAFMTSSFSWISPPQITGTLLIEQIFLIIFGTMIPGRISIMSG